MANYSRLQNITTAFARLFSNSKPGEFVSRNSIENALAATNRPSASAPIIEPTVISDKGIDRGAIFSAEHGVSKDYHRYLERESMRHMRYTLYERMDSDLIGSALDVYANEATQKNSEGNIIGVYSKSKYIQDELRNMFEDIGLNNYRTWPILRDMCKYGDKFCALKLDSVRGVISLKELDNISVYRIEKDGELEGYIQDLDVLKSNVQNANVTSATMNPYVNLNTLSLPYLTGDSSVITKDGEDALVPFLKYEMAHFRLRGKGTFYPYGVSILDSSVDVWKKLDLLFDSLIIYRLNRAPSRLVFYVDVGTNQGADAENIVRRQINAVNKKEYFGANGKLNERYQLLDMNANIFLPMQKGSQSKVEMMQGAANVGEIEDVAFLNNRLFSALKVPKSFLGYEGDVSGKGMLSQQNVTFGKAIQNIQEDFLETLKDICIIHLAIRGVSSKDELKSFNLVMQRPSYIEEKARLELDGELLKLAGDYSAFGASKTWCAKNILRKSEAEIAEMFKPDEFTQQPGAEGGMGMPGGMGGMDMGMGGGMGLPEMGGATELPPAPAGGTPIMPPAPTGGEIPAAPAGAPGEVPLTQSMTYSGSILMETKNTVTTVANFDRKLLEYVELLKGGLNIRTVSGEVSTLTESKKNTLSNPEDIFNV